MKYENFTWFPEILGNFSPTFFFFFFFCGSLSHEVLEICQLSSQSRHTIGKEKMKDIQYIIFIYYFKLVLYM